MLSPHVTPFRRSPEFNRELGGGLLPWKIMAHNAAPPEFLSCLGGFRFTCHLSSWCGKFSSLTLISTYLERLLKIKLTLTQWRL
jgi:hypothetical protein